MSRQPVDEVVSWTIRPTPARVRAAGLGQFLVRIVRLLAAVRRSSPVASDPRTPGPIFEPTSLRRPHGTGGVRGVE